MVDTSSLNINQFGAVVWESGPILVLAGPGSGKTHALIYRMARIIEESAGENFRILGLTFTDRAARRMRKRVNSLVPNADGRINLTTYHSFSAALLRQHGHLVGISPDFAILSQDAERTAVLDKAVARAKTLHTHEYTGKKLLPVITTLTDQNFSADESSKFLQRIFPDKYRQIGEIYGHYRQLMIENNELDFGTLMAKALKLVTMTPVANLIRCIYPHICVDEFQHTTPIQYQILCRMVDPATKNLFVAADDCQTIHEWSDTYPERLEHIQERFGMATLNLPESYRCPPEIVRMANQLIANNPCRVRPGETAGKPNGRDQPVRVRIFETHREEIKWVAKDIMNLPADKQGRCAVLAMARTPLEQIVAELKKHNIRGHIHVRKDEFTNDRMVWLYSILRLANSRQDDIQLHRICKSFYALEGVSLTTADVMSKASVWDGDYLRAWLYVALQEEKLNPDTRLFLNDTIPKLTDRMDPDGFLRDCFGWFEQRQQNNPEPDYNTEYRIERDVWENLASDAKHDTGQNRVTLSALLQQVNLKSKEPPAPKGAINCYTLFASRGLDFDHVYLIRLAEDDLPNWRATKKGDDSREMQEERRVCFAAITRTQKSLTLTCPLHVSNDKKSVSRFLAEMGIAETPRV